MTEKPDTQMSEKPDTQAILMSGGISGPDP
jgi:hypothetical protein